MAINSNNGTILNDYIDSGGVDYLESKTLIFIIFIIFIILILFLLYKLIINTNHGSRHIKIFNNR